MNINDILLSLGTTNQPIILILGFNSNPDFFVQKYISKLNDKNDIQDLKNYSDLIIFGENDRFKKDDAISLKKFCSYSSIDENNKKFYFIKNFDSSTNEAYNSMLKFIEEPFDNVYGIFTVNKINNVPLTIRSRCKIYSLDTDNNFVNDILSIKPDIPRWAFHIFNDTKLSDFINSKMYDDFCTVINFLENKKIDLFNDVLAIFKTWNFNDIRLFLKAILSIASQSQIKEILMIDEIIYLNPSKSLIISKLIKIFWYLEEEDK